MKREVSLMVKQVYGRDLVYPISDTAKALVALTGRQTFKAQDIEVIKSMGFHVTYITREPNFGKADE